MGALTMKRIIAYVLAVGLVFASSSPVMAKSLCVSSDTGIDMIFPKVKSLKPGRVIVLTGVDQFGKTHTLPSTYGPKGAMLVFFRSADW